jgi:hypothetical protein
MTDIAALVAELQDIVADHGASDHMFIMETARKAASALSAQGERERKMREALEDIAFGRVPRLSRSGMFMVTAADHARAALKSTPDTTQG